MGMRVYSFRAQGFSLVEILLVMAILALLSIAAFVILAQVNDANQSNTETKNITTIIVGVRNLYAIKGDYAGLTTAVANQAHVFPRPMNYGNFSATAPVKNMFDGDVEVMPWDVNLRRFAVIYKDVPQRICVRIAQNYGKNVDEVLVGGVHVKSLGDIGSDPMLTVVECNRTPLVDITFIQK